MGSHIVCDHGQIIDGPPDRKATGYQMGEAEKRLAVQFLVITADGEWPDDHRAALRDDVVAALDEAWRAGWNAAMGGGNDTTVD